MSGEGDGGDATTLPGSATLSWSLYTLRTEWHQHEEPGLDGAIPHSLSVALDVRPPCLRAAQLDVAESAEGWGLRNGEARLVDGDALGGGGDLDVRHAGLLLLLPQCGRRGGGGGGGVVRVEAREVWYRHWRRYGLID